MRIPHDAVIATEKLVDYLLKPRPWDVKSGYLALAGFDSENWRDLESAIRKLCISAEADRDDSNAYGIFWKVTCELAGVNERNLPVTLIWIRRHSDEQFHFVTLRPPRRDERLKYGLEG